MENCKSIPFLGEFPNFLHKFVYKMLFFFLLSDKPCSTRPFSRDFRMIYLIRKRFLRVLDTDVFQRKASNMLRKVVLDCVVSFHFILSFHIWKLMLQSGGCQKFRKVQRYVWMPDLWEHQLAEVCAEFPSLIEFLPSFTDFFFFFGSCSKYFKCFGSQCKVTSGWS